MHSKVLWLTMHEKNETMTVHLAYKFVIDKFFNLEQAGRVG